MCFDCLTAFSPFSSSANALVGAKKTLHRISRPNSPAPPEDAYGPALKEDLYQEELPDDKSIDKRVSNISVDDGFGEADSGTCEDDMPSENNSMDPKTGMELDAVALVDMDNTDTANHKESPPPDEKSNHEEQPETPPPDTKFVYEQEVELEVETSLDDNLPIGSKDNKSEDANQSKQELLVATNDPSQQKIKKELPGKVVGHLEVTLEYDEAGSRLKVAVMKASDLATKQQGGFNNYRVRIVLRPNKQQSSKTHIRPADAPVFRELFRFRQLPKNELSTSELHFKLHGCGKYGKEKFVGDASLNLSAMKAADKQSFNIPLVNQE